MTGAACSNFQLMMVVCESDRSGQPMQFGCSVFGEAETDGGQGVVELLPGAASEYGNDGKGMRPQKGENELIDGTPHPCHS